MRGRGVDKMITRNCVVHNMVNPYIWNRSYEQLDKESILFFLLPSEKYLCVKFILTTDENLYSISYHWNTLKEVEHFSFKSREF